jgi:hypothetical protein
MNGKIEILNVGTGDTKIHFDKDNPADVERAKRIIPDMIKRGYALFCEVNGELERVEGFDPEKSEYIVRLPWETEWNDKLEQPAEPQAQAEEPVAAPAPEKKKRGRKARVPLTEGKVIAVGRSAGG